MKIVKYVLPAFWASALINGDYTGLSDEEEGSINGWLETHPVGAALSCTEQAEFRRYYDADGLACDCLTFTFPAR